MTIEPFDHLKIMHFEFSAGGIVSKNEQGKLMILLAQHSGHHGWVFPKGHLDQGETKIEAALREVQEETGVIGKIIQPLTPIQYWFVLDNEKIKKTVYYFQMEYVGGDITQHDFEMENVEWLPANKVSKRLTFASDKKAWQEAKKLLHNGGIA